MLSKAPIQQRQPLAVCRTSLYLYCTHICICICIKKYLYWERGAVKSTYPADSLWQFAEQVCICICICICIRFCIYILQSHLLAHNSLIDSTLSTGGKQTNKAIESIEQNNGQQYTNNAIRHGNTCERHCNDSHDCTKIKSRKF